MEDQALIGLHFLFCFIDLITQLLQCKNCFIVRRDAAESDLVECCYVHTLNLKQAGEKKKC